MSVRIVVRWMEVVPGFAASFVPTPLTGGAWSEKPRVAPEGRARVNTPSLAFADEACIVVRRVMEPGCDWRLCEIEDGVVGGGWKKGELGRDLGIRVSPRLEGRDAGCLNTGIGGGGGVLLYVGLMARVRNDEDGAARIGVPSWFWNDGAGGFLAGGVSSITKTHPGEPSDADVGCALRV